MNLLKEFFIYVTVFLISSISIWFFPVVSISQLKLSIWFCILSTFSIMALNILITVILNFLSISVSCLSLFLMIDLSIQSVFFLPFCGSLFFNWKLNICERHRYYLGDKYSFLSARLLVLGCINLVRGWAEFQVGCYYGCQLCITDFKFL